MSGLLPFLIRPSADLLSKHPGLYQLAQQLSRHYDAGCVTETDLKAIGEALWQVLNIDTILPSQALMIDCYNHAIDSLPWECLYHSQFGFLGKHSDYTLSRRIVSHHKNRPPSTTPLKILLLTAQPTKIFLKRARLDIETEQHWVTNALEPDINAGNVQFYAPNDGRLSTLVRLLHSQPWHVVILSGHGIVQTNLSTTEASDEPIIATAEDKHLKSAFFVFESDDGEGESVAADTLASVFKRTHVQCVVVAACQSAQGLIMPIAQAGVPHVVGMREPLIDRAGTVFVRTLCVALARQQRIDVAVQQGRRAMTQLLASNEVWRDAAVGVSHSEAGQWCLPMLLSQDLTQPIVDWHFCPKPRPPNQLGSQIALPKLFMGRRQELRTLEEQLGSGKIPRLLILGTAGIGKTALAGRLVMSLVAQKNYRVLAYQPNDKVGFAETLTHIFEESCEQNLVRVRQFKPKNAMSRTLENVFFDALEQLIQGRWILWLDGLEKILNPNQRLLTDSEVQTALEILCQSKTTELRIILTSRLAIPSVRNFDQYRLQRPNFNDFSRYLEQTGLRYSFPQRLKIYQMLEGNYQAAQLLQSLPVCQKTTNLDEQLVLVRRYLQAYQRENRKTSSLS
jgi:hypothetical protein